MGKFGHQNSPGWRGDAAVSPPSMVKHWPVMYCASSGREPRHGIGDVRRLAEAAGRVARQRVGFRGLGVVRLGKGILRHAGHDPTRSNGVASDLGSVIHSDRTGQTVDEGLGRIVERHGGVADDARDRSDIDDRAAVLLHVGQDRAAHIEDAPAIDADNQVPVLIGAVGQGLFDLNTGIVDQD